MFQDLRTDLRFSLRLLRTSPVLTVVAVLAISLGAGAVTTIFSAMNALVLRPVPGVADPSRVVGLEFRRRDGSVEQAASYRSYVQLRDQSRTVGAGAWTKATLSIATGGGAAARVVNDAFASGDYFSVLGIRPTLGRFFLPEEDRAPLGRPVIVVSYSFWSTTLGADSSAIGKTVSVNGNAYTLIGVAPDGFRGLTTVIPVDGWIPITRETQMQPGRTLQTLTSLRVFARLRPGVTMQSATAELSTLLAVQSQIGHPEAVNRLIGVQLAELRPVPEDARKLFLGFMAILMAAATFVLFIASVNVAAMLSARAVARRQEMAVRAALGASRGRLVTQTLTEVLVLFVIGAIGAIAVAFVATRLATHFPLPAPVVLPPNLAPDARVMAFALCVSLITGCVFGVTPALLASRDDVSGRLRDGSRGAVARRSKAATALIVGQLALSLVLLVAAGLFFRSLQRAAAVDPGFARDGLTIASLDTRTWGYDDARGRQFYSALRDRVAALPGVTNVTFASFAPLTTRNSNDSLTLPNGERAFSWLVGASDGCFETLRMPLVAGRAIAVTDDNRAPRVAVVNETLARRIAPSDGASALGRTFLRGNVSVTVVGIARDAKYATLDELTPGLAFLPMAQWWQPNQTLLVRGSSPSQMSRGFRDALRSIDPLLPVPALITLDDASRVTVLPQRIALTVTGALGLVGLLLATVGLYGIIAYSMSRRTREMGVRIALGAQRANVMGLVLGDGLRLAGAGILVGLLLSAAATRIIAGLLLGVHALDAATFLVAPAFLLAVTLAATFIPAAKAAALDPVEALRSE